MNENKSNNGPSSAAMSPSAPEQHAPNAHAGLSESEFLAKQAADAREAIHRVWSDVKHSLSSTADVKAWTQRYPLIATGTAVAAGLAAGYVLAPRNRDEAREMWESLKGHLTPTPAKDSDGKTEAASPPQPSILSSFLREAVKVAGPLLASLVAAKTADNEENSESKRTVDA